MLEGLRAPLAVVVLVLSAYSVAKFLFFTLDYPRRRAAVDRQYAGRAAPGLGPDLALLALATGLGAALLLTGSEPIAFLGGMFVGATLIQLFFHSFREPVPLDHEAPEPVSPLKRMSYAIQDRPGRALKEMLVMTALIVWGFALHLMRG
jgi:hypothetical protein